MMIEEKIEQIKGLITQIIPLLEATLKDLEVQILDLNRQEQLFKKGINTDGAKLQPPYSAPYKKKHNKPDYVNLYLSGNFYESFKIDLDKDKFWIRNNPVEMQRGFDLAGHLTKVYGKEVLGLTDENLDKLRSMVLEKFRSKLNDYIKSN